MDDLRRGRLGLVGPQELEGQDPLQVLVELVIPTAGQFEVDEESCAGWNRRRTSGRSIAHFGGNLDPAPTHAQIPSRISTPRQAVTRELRHLASADEWLLWVAFPEDFYVIYPYTLER